MQAQELSGALLDYCVAILEREKNALPIWTLGRDLMQCVSGIVEYSPSTDWSYGGPIIEREGIATYKARVCWLANCAAYLDDEKPPLQGSTPLEAAMRCYVAAKATPGQIEQWVTEARR